MKRSSKQAPSLTRPVKSAAEDRESRRGLLSVRVLLLGFLLIPLNAWWLTQTEYIRYSDNVTTQALYFNAIGFLLLLVAVNALLRRVFPRAVFSTAELFGLYLIVTVGSGLAGHDTLQILFTTITYPTRQITGGDPMFGPEMLATTPDSLVVKDQAAIDALYAGNSTLYRWDHIRPWLAPLGWWSLFVLLLVWTMLCLTALFRRQWENERLAYPITEIPIEILTQEKTLFRTPLLWLGFLVGASLQVVNVLHVLFPAIPGAFTGVYYFDADRYPWSAAGAIPICSYAFAYGLTFLLPTQLSFSCWFFFLVSRLELVGAAMHGYTAGGKFPYVQQQGVGAVFGFFLAIVWAARGHLSRVWKSATGSGPVMEDAGEPLPYGTAVFGLIAGLAGMVLFAVAVAGMQWITALLFLGILLIIVVVVARLRAELGLPTFELYQVGADQVLPAATGTQAWTSGDYTAMTLFFFLTRTHRQFPMQTHTDAMQIGARIGTPLRSLTTLILLASAWGIVCAFWSYLHSVYVVGFESARFQGPALWAFGKEPWNKWHHFLHSPQPPDGGAMAAYGFGALFTLFLVVMRSRFLWWPFHPAGYLVSSSNGLFRLWLPIFVSWAIKSLLLRYGGLVAYRRALPFAYGLVLGEFSVGFLRSLLDVGLGLGLPPGSGIGGL